MFQGFRISGVSVRGWRILTMLILPSCETTLIASIPTLKLTKREYRRWESNPYFLRNAILNRARLPIPPRRLPLGGAESWRSPRPCQAPACPESPKIPPPRFSPRGTFGRSPLFPKTRSARLPPRSFRPPLPGRFQSFGDPPPARQSACPDWAWRP